MNQKNFDSSSPFHLSLKQEIYGKLDKYDSQIYHKINHLYNVFKKSFLHFLHFHLF
jgi:hypothetical protein